MVYSASESPKGHVYKTVKGEARLPKLGTEVQSIWRKHVGEAWALMNGQKVDY